jgi:hypothetical protein
MIVDKVIKEHSSEEKMVTITEQYYNYLLRREVFINCLNDVGVRKLEVWNKAMKKFESADVQYCTNKSAAKTV